MGNMGRLIVAVALAAAAGIGNYIWLWQAGHKHEQFVCLKQDVAEGQRIEREMLTAVRIPGDVAQLRKSFVLANRESMALLVGTRAPRDMQAGDLILHQDLNSTLPRWKALGPFRLVSVGEQVVGADYSGQSSGNSVTIAAEVDEQGNYDARVERLLDILDAQRSKSRDQSGQRIVAIQLEPMQSSGGAEAEETGGLAGAGGLAGLSGDVPAARQPLDLRPNERGIIVPLRDVENLPDLLSRGNHISFIVAWYDDTLEKLNTSVMAQP